MKKCLESCSKLFAGCGSCCGILIPPLLFVAFAHFFFGVEKGRDEGERPADIGQKSDIYRETGVRPTT